MEALMQWWNTLVENMLWIATSLPSWLILSWGLIAHLFTVAYDTVGGLGLAIDIAAFLVFCGFIYKVGCQVLILHRWTCFLRDWQAELAAIEAMRSEDDQSVIGTVEEELAQDQGRIPKLYLLTRKDYAGN